MRSSCIECCSVFISRPLEFWASQAQILLSFVFCPWKRCRNYVLAQICVEWPAVEAHSAWLTFWWIANQLSFYSGAVVHTLIGQPIGNGWTARRWRCCKQTCYSAAVRLITGAMMCRQLNEKLFLESHVYSKATIFNGSIEFSLTIPSGGWNCCRMRRAVFTRWSSLKRVTQSSVWCAR